MPQFLSYLLGLNKTWDASVFRGKYRAAAFGVWGAVISGAAAVGPLAGGALTEWVSWYSRLSRARPRLVGAPILIQLLWLDLVRKRGYFTGSARAHDFGRGLRAVNQVGKAPRAGSPLGAVVS